MAAKTEKSQTLVRRIVKKPPAQIRPTGQNASVGLSHRSVLGSPPAGRLSRASQTGPSSLVSHFAKSAASRQPKLSGDLKVAVPPKTFDTAPAAPPFLSRLIRKGVKPAAFHHPLSGKAAVGLAEKKPTKISRLSSPLRRLAPGRRTLKIISVALVCLAVLAAAAVISIQKMPPVEMRLADIKAGFRGHVPGGVPAGYNFKSPIISGKGTITVQYRSADSKNSFAITQRPTSWNSASLTSNFLNNAGLEYQTYNAPDGLTIYVFEADDATWVDNGIWYSLTGQDNLTTNQILTIADSL